MSMRHRAFIVPVLGVSALAVFGCEAPKDSAQLKIVGGQNAEGDHPEVVLLEVDQYEQRICTGVAVSPTTALMAGHCVKRQTQMDGVFLNAPGRPQSKFLYTWRAIGGAEVIDNALAVRDVAVVVFPSPVFTSYATLGSERPAVGASPTPVMLVGYGTGTLSTQSLDPNAAAGIKRHGSNVVARYIDSSVDQDLAADERAYEITANVTATGLSAAVGAAGDSGGPLYVGEGVNRRLVGLAAGYYLERADRSRTDIVTSQSGTLVPNDAGAVKAVNVFVDLTSDASRKLLSYAVADRPNGEQGAVVTGLVEIPSSLNVGVLDAPWTEAIDPGTRTLKGDQMVAMCGAGGAGRPGGVAGDGGSIAGNRGVDTGAITGDGITGPNTNAGLANTSDTTGRDVTNTGGVGGW